MKDTREIVLVRMVFSPATYDHALNGGKRNMANICQYNCIVKGAKNACYAVYGSMSCCDDKSIIAESGTPENYTMQFTGDCKWSVDSYCNAREDLTPFVIPQAPNEAMRFGEDNWYIPQSQKSTLFNVEFWCNSADIEDYDPEWYSECGGFYEHYLPGSDTCIDDACPEELYLYPEDEWDDDEEEFEDDDSGDEK